MLNLLGSLTFAAPLALAALAALPLIWLLLRLVPPVPRRVTFPPVAILARIANREEAAVRTPLWLIILRTILLTAAILAAAGPVLNPDRSLTGNGPVLIIVDDGWSAAPHWDQTRQSMEALLDQAAARGRPVRVMTTAGGLAFPDTGFGVAREVATQVATLRPQPWAPDLKALAGRLDGDAGRMETGLAIWLSDGIDHAGAAALASWLTGVGEARIHGPSDHRLPMILDAPSGQNDGLMIKVRASDGRPTPPVVRAMDGENRVLARRILERQADGGHGGELPLPLEQRNRVERLELEGEHTAAAVFLMDERWRRRAVGIATLGGRNVQPLLSEHYYLRRALSPYVDLREGRVGDLLARPLGMLILPDSVGLAATDLDKVKEWVAQGGVLLRFAGPRTLGDSADSLFPETLLPTSRNLEGGMSWSSAAGIDSFAAGSPFKGLAVPDDLKVSRQALARPTPDSQAVIWARLADRTPLVSALPLEKGWSVMFHVPANTAWSNLPLSGLFVEMLRRLSSMGRGQVSETKDETLRPERTLDGFGQLEPASRSARPVADAELASLTLSASHPPGFYTAQGTRRAVNLGPRLDTPTLMPPALSGLAITPMQDSREESLAPWLWVLALILLMVDGVAALVLRGAIRRRVAVMVLAGVALSVAGATPGQAQTPSAVELAGETRFAYLRSGDAQIDQATHAGLEGLTNVLAQRTAAELGPPVGIDPAVDVLDFFPMIYWAVPEDAGPLSATAVDRLNRFMEGGGMLVIDTRGTGLTLRGLVGGLRIPPLRAVPQDHVLTRSFFLISNFPGRYEGATVWVARDEAQSLDGVSQVVIGDHDWAGAWAIDAQGQPSFPVVPGGENQREWAYRFGINLAMYVLTGNYKADQVHLPTIMERLGL